MKHVYELLSGNHGRFENGVNVLYRPRMLDKPGDKIELTEEEAIAFGSRVRLIEGQLVKQPETEAVSEPKVDVVAEDLTPSIPDVEPEEAEVEDTPQDNPYDLSQLSWSDAKSVIDSLTTVEDLSLAREAEVNGSNRKTVLAAITRAAKKL